MVLIIILALVPIKLVYLFARIVANGVSDGGCHLGKLIEIVDVAQYLVPVACDVHQLGIVDIVGHSDNEHLKKKTVSI